MMLLFFPCCFLNLCTVFVSSHRVYKNKASNTCMYKYTHLLFSPIDNVMHTFMYFSQLATHLTQTWFKLCSVMKTTEVFIYVQCNPCIGKLTVNYINKSFQYFYYFFSIFCRFRFCIEEHCWSVFFFKLMYMLKLQNKSAHVFLD